MGSDVAATFGTVAGQYAAARPGYPDRLFAWLASQAPSTQLAWDCAAGSGQASVGLARHFEHVIATDASIEQIARAAADPRIDYRVAPAEHSGLADGSVDLVTVAQALHWLPLDGFYAEARRVARPGALIAVWTYHWLTTGCARIDAIVDQLDLNTVDDYWPAGRAHVETEYADLDFPFEPITTPRFEMSARWTVDRLAGYLRSWSAVARYAEANGTDPVDEVDRRLARFWSPGVVREVRWPLTVLVGRIA